MPLIQSSSKKALKANIKAEMDAKPSSKSRAQDLAIAYETQRRNAKRKKLAEGGEVGGAETSTTGNKTKTGGSNPGGASTGGAGTVTITTGENPPKSISVSDVGGRTEARNAGGMDPSDENDDMMAGDMDPEADDMMAEGGEVEEAGMYEPQADRDAEIEAEQREIERSNPMRRSLVSQILEKRRKMAAGGEVEMEEPDEETILEHGEGRFELPFQHDYDNLGPLEDETEDPELEQEGRLTSIADQIRAKQRSLRRR